MFADSVFSFFCDNCKDKVERNFEQCYIESVAKHYARGEHIAFYGASINYLYVLVKGSVKTELVSEGGVMLPTEQIVAPYPLAAAFMFADEKRFPFDIIATSDCEVRLISRADVEKRMMSCKGFMMGFTHFNANRIAHLTTRLKVFAHRGLKAKLAYYILEHEQGERAYSFSLPSAELASYLGVERPSLSRALGELVREGVITHRKGQGEILQRERLISLMR